MPDNFGCVTTLQTLNLEKNELTTLPASIGHCKFLCELNLKQNPVETLPTSLGLIGVTLEVLELDESDYLNAGIRERLGDTQKLLQFLAEKGNHVYNTKISVHKNKISKPGLYPSLIDKKSESETDLERYLLEQHAQAETAAILAMKAINDLDEQAKIQAMRVHEENEKVISETMKVLDLEEENSKKLVLAMAEDRSRYTRFLKNVFSGFFTRTAAPASVVGRFGVNNRNFHNVSPGPGLLAFFLGVFGDVFGDLFSPEPDIFKKPPCIYKKPQT